jgi:hypothetical protein
MAKNPPLLASDPNGFLEEIDRIDWGRQFPTNHLNPAIEGVVPMSTLHLDE